MALTLATLLGFDAPVKRRRDPRRLSPATAQEQTDALHYRPQIAA